MERRFIDFLEDLDEDNLIITKGVKQCEYIHNMNRNIVLSDVDSFVMLNSKICFYIKGYVGNNDYIVTRANNNKIEFNIFNTLTEELLLMEWCEYIEFSTPSVVIISYENKMFTFDITEERILSKKYDVICKLPMQLIAFDGTKQVVLLDWYGNDMGRIDPSTLIYTSFVTYKGQKCQFLDIFHLVCEQNS